MVNRILWGKQSTLSFLPIYHQEFIYDSLWYVWYMFERLPATCMIVFWENLKPQKQDLVTLFSA